MEPVKYKKKLEIRDYTYKYLENTFADKTTGTIYSGGSSNYGWTWIRLIFGRVSEAA